MHVSLICPCGAKLRAPEKYIGHELDCPKCGEKIIVPEPAKATMANNPLEVLEDDDPLASHAAHPAAPLTAAAPVATRKAAKSSKAKRGTSLLLIGGIVIAALAIFGGILLYIQMSERSQLSEDLQKANRSERQKWQSVAEDRRREEAELESRKASATETQNDFDSGVKDLYAGSGEPNASELSMAELIEKIEPSIVRIKVTTYDGEQRLGSGFFIESEGKIATNFHVIDKAETVTVSTHQGRQTQVLGFVAAEPKRDLAILQIDPDSLPITPVALAKDLPQKGESVAAFGAPQGFGFTTTEGIVSAVRPGVEMRETLKELAQADIYLMMGMAQDMNWIQTTAAISGGNSGGPLVNMRGEVVGINTWTHPGGQNLNFSSSLAELKKVFEARSGQLYSWGKLPPSNRNPNEY